MLHPTHLLRDAALIATVLAAVGVVGGPWLAALSVGAAACALNMLLITLSVGHGGPWVWARLALKLPLAAGAMVLLARQFDALPLILGFGGTLIAMSAVALWRNQRAVEIV